MTALDWAVVAVLNGGIVAYSLIAFRNKGESFDWYLAAKSMPWWVIGLSAFGTAIDSGDYVGIVGGAYNIGLSQLAQWWLGIGIGWTVLSFFVIVPMYRSGVFTNAEWLEFRFGPTARVLAVLINVQSRTNVLGNIFFSMFLVLNIVAGIEETTCWFIVVGVAITSVLYIVRGGLRPSRLPRDAITWGVCVCVRVLIGARNRAAAAAPHAVGLLRNERPPCCATR